MVSSTKNRRVKGSRFYFSSTMISSSWVKVYINFIIFKSNKVMFLIPNVKTIGFSTLIQVPTQH